MINLECDLLDSSQLDLVQNVNHSSIGHLAVAIDKHLLVGIGRIQSHQFHKKSVGINGFLIEKHPAFFIDADAQEIVLGFRLGRGSDRQIYLDRFHVHHAQCCSWCSDNIHRLPAPSN